MSDKSHQPDETEEAATGEDTVDQPTVNLKRDQPTKPLLEDEPAEYELPDPAPRPSQSAGEDAPGLPTSDPVFPTASPQLKPPVTPPTGDDADLAAPQAAPAKPGAASAPARPAASATPAPKPVVTAADAGLAQPLPRTAPPRQRSAAEIRADIEAGRQELSQSVEVLRDKVEELTDWRGQVRKHRREITIAAAAVGFVVGARFMMKRRRR